jgi:hypothetical protein
MFVVHNALTPDVNAVTQAAAPVVQPTAVRDATPFGTTTRCDLWINVTHESTAPKTH